MFYGLKPEINAFTHSFMYIKVEWIFIVWQQNDNQHGTSVVTVSLYNVK